MMQRRRSCPASHSASLARAIALEAMAEGKDVYIEKPISHVYNEGPLIIAAAKKHNPAVTKISIVSPHLVDNSHLIVCDMASVG